MAGSSEDKALLEQILLESTASDSGSPAARKESCGCCPPSSFLLHFPRGASLRATVSATEEQ